MFYHVFSNFFNCHSTDNNTLQQRHPFYGLYKQCINSDFYTIIAVCQWVIPGLSCKGLKTWVDLNQFILVLLRNLFSRENYLNS